MKKAASSFMIIWILIGLGSGPAFAQALENSLAKYMAEHEETGAGAAAIIIDGDEVIYNMTGYADLEKRIPVGEETVFEWGSVSKVLIWISILQLAEDGELDLERDIKTYLPKDFRSKITYEEPVTLQHLMHHTAGFDDSYTDLFVPLPAEEIPLKKVLEEADIKQVFPPGQIVSYSNYGSGLAALIVESVSGMDYRDYVRKRIFVPLGMEKTAIDPKLDDKQWVREQRGKIQGYTADRQLIEPNRYMIPMYPAGSVTGTAGDLKKVLQALLAEDGRPLFQKAKTVESLFQPSLHYPESDLPRLANGLFFLPSESGNVFGHGGNTAAFSSSFYADRTERKGVLVLTNIANESTYTLGIPELVFRRFDYSGNGAELEDSSKWQGIYEPARVPRHGFSKVYGLFLRSKAESAGSHDLLMNGLRYKQAAPGTFITQDDFSAYAIDVYSGTPRLLSSGQADLLYIPFYRHALEWAGVVLAALAFLFSFGALIAGLIRKEKQPIPISGQHLVNILVSGNVIWVVYKTMSYTTYASIQPFLVANGIYIAVSAVLVGLIFYKKLHKTPAGMVAIFSAIILCANLLYWEFYH